MAGSVVAFWGHVCVIADAVVVSQTPIRSLQFHGPPTACVVRSEPRGVQPMLLCVSVVRSRFEVCGLEASARCISGYSQLGLVKARPQR